MSPKKAAAALPTIHVVYPTAQHLVLEDSTFFMGQVRYAPKTAVLYINQEQVPRSPQGFFSWKVPIHPGKNVFSLSIRSRKTGPKNLVETLHTVMGEGPYQLAPSSTKPCIPETILPESDVWLTKTDVLTVACFAGENAQVSVSFPGWIEKPIPVPAFSSLMPFVDTREVIFSQLHWTQRRIPTQGAYQLQIPIAHLLTLAKKQPVGPLSLMLHIDRNGQRYTQPIPGKLRILTASFNGISTENLIVSRTTPPNGARLTPQIGNTRFQLDGLEKGWLRAKLGSDQHFYLPEKNIQLDERHAHSMAALQLATIETRALQPERAEVSLRFSGSPAYACPILIETPPSKTMNRLIVKLYNVCSICDFIQYAPTDSLIQQIHWRAIEKDVLEVWIDLNQSLAGYDYRWENGCWILTLQSLPKHRQNVKILIDPGHGGTEHGSTGLNGLPEKTLNLTVAKQLADTLKQAGFQVKLTRTTDRNVELPERGALAQREKPHIVLSLHHNALPDGRDPLQAEGACCFYYHAFSKPLAEKLLQGLAHPQIDAKYTIPNYGLFYDSLYMTRIHEALAVLVEVGFFTNPAEFERLIQPTFQKEVVQRLTEALIAYCDS